MATWAQWRVHADSGEVRKVTWVCGSERVLVEEVVDHVRATLACSDLDRACYDAGSTPDKEIWASINQYSLEPGAKRLTVVRDAEKIKRWQPMIEWLQESRLTPNSYLLLVSNDTELPYVKKDGKTDGLQPFAEAIKARGHLVRCATPSEEALVGWVQRRVACSEDTAKYLLERSAGELGLVQSVGQKLALFPGEPSREIIDVLCVERPAEDFTEAIISGRKPKALSALEGLSERDYSKVIGLLDSRLDLLSKLHLALRRRMSMREIVSMKGVHVFIARPLIPYSKNYDPIRVRRCRQLLAVIDDALRSGARDGCMEALVSLW